MSPNTPSIQQQLPLVNAYWVILGKLAAGEYPIDRFLDDKSRKILGGLLDCGILNFINLTQPDELPSYTQLLQEQAAWRGMAAKTHHFPINDYFAPSPDQMNEILSSIDTALSHGEGVYIHCRAGIGRTGGVVGCYLVHQGLSGEEALIRIRSLRQGLPNAWIESPESDAQRELVLNWHSLEQQRPSLGSVHHP
jgi:hypothetical protein